MKPIDTFAKFDTQIQTVLCLIGNEVLKAREKHPKWPNDKIHAAAIVQEETGELIRAAVQFVYENGNESEMKKEAIQTGAMTVRFLNNY